MGRKTYVDLGGRVTESLGGIIRRLRKERGFSQRELAERAHVSTSHVSNVELGRFRAGAGVLAALGAALDVDLPTPFPSPYPWAVPTSDSVALVPVHQPDGSVIIVEMNRRTFLATAAAAAGAGAQPVALPDRVTPDVLGALSDRLAWHTAASATTGPYTIAAAVQADLDAVMRVVRSAPTQLRPDALGLAARYAEYLGWMRQDAGDEMSALYWTDRAADYAQAAGWRHMIAYTFVRKVGMLQQNNPKQAAEMAHATRTGPWRLTPGLTALVAGGEAEAHAHAGAHGDSDRALDAARRALARMDVAEEPPLGPSMLGVRDLPAAVWSARCDLLLGREHDAIPTLIPIVDASPGARGRAVDGARLARAYAKVGAVDDACRAATAATIAGKAASSATAMRALRELRPALQPWARRDDVDQVLAALPA